MKKKVCKALLFVAVALIFSSGSVFALTNEDTKNLLQLVESQRTIASKIEIYYTSAVLNEKKATLKYKKSGVSGFIFAKDAFTKAKMRYVEATEDLAKALDLLKGAIQNKNKSMMNGSEYYLDNVISGLTEAAVKYQNGLKFFIASELIIKKDEKAAVLSF